MRIVALLMIGATIAVAASDDRQSGHDHFYNLEYDEAIAGFAKLIDQNPADPIPYNDLASAELYKELYRLGLLDTSALGRDNRAAPSHPAQPDPGAKARFLDTLERGQRAAENILAQDRRNEAALYALCTDYALRATYDFLLDKSWLSALRSGSKARGYCEEVRNLNPLFIDAYLVLGVYEYAAGSLPLPVKLLAAVGGLHGSKSKGIEYITRVAQQGKYERDAARVVLAVVWRREKRPQEAARIFASLMADYPRNYIFGLELASIYTDADRPERALDVLRTLLQRAGQNVAGDVRLPREKVQLQIETLEAKLSVRPHASARRVWP